MLVPWARRGLMEAFPSNVAADRVGQSYKRADACWLWPELKFVVFAILRLLFSTASRRFGGLWAW